MNKIIHFKKHKNCNLFCEGCVSSVNSVKNKVTISEEDNDNIFNTISKINEVTNPGSDIKYDIQFFGGEPLLDVEDLEYYENTVKKYSDVIEHYGIQSNFSFNDKIYDKLVNNMNMWFKRLGTSYNFNNTRMLNNSSKEFKNKFFNNYKKVSKKFGYNIPIIIVITPDNVDKIYTYFKILNKNNIDVTFYHFLPFGKKTSYFTYYNEDKYHEKFSEGMIKILKDKNKKIRVHPIDKIKDSFSNNVDFGCGMQLDCFKKSVCVEASGDIFVCTELSALGLYPLGNWKKQTVYNDNIKALKKRVSHVDKDCLKCKYFSHCKSGCMAEGFVKNKNLYEKTYMCKSWLKIFDFLDKN